MNLKALYKLSYGVYIICSRKGEKYNGQVANTLVQVASEPPIVAVSINKNNLTHDYIKESHVFTASVLAQETPLSFIGKFGFKTGRETDKFEGTGYRIGVTGVPVVLENTVSYLEVKVSGEIDAVTHTVFLGEVIEADVISDRSSMTYEYYHQVKKGATPKTAPGYIPPADKEVQNKATTKYSCSICGYVYDPENGDPDSGIIPGTAFEDLPATWSCPVCGASKDYFAKL